MNDAERFASRRRFLAETAAATAALAWAGRRAVAAPESAGNTFCAFVKGVQSLSYDQLADAMVEIGFNGIEATVRNKGHVLPERVEDDLPKLVEALKKRGLEITVMASDVNSVDQPLTEKVLRTASGLGVKRYRMGGYKYTFDRPIPDQIEDLRPVVADLVAMNRELGISAVYQNHSGGNNFGAPIWDLHQLIKDYPTSDIGVAFDIRHATVEGGLAWPIHFHLMRPHFDAVYVKDFVWHGRRAENVPLGEGQVDPRFFRMLRESGYNGPISVHVEYLLDADAKANLEALSTDLKTARKLLAA